MTSQFQELAEHLYSEWVIQCNEHQYQIIEAEFLLKSKSTIHNDPNIDAAAAQYMMAQWYIPEAGVDITFGTPEYAAAVFIRGIRDIQSGDEIVGPLKVFQTLFQHLGSAFAPRINAQLVPHPSPKPEAIFNVPRVNLMIKEGDERFEHQLKYLFRPYRFINRATKEFPDKYLAALYCDKIHGTQPSASIQPSIYHKYLNAYAQGCQWGIDKIWRISSRSHRTAALLGYTHTHQPEDLV